MNRFLIISALLWAGVASASPLRWTGNDFMEMNETYQTGMIHGMLLTFLDHSGTSTQWGDFVRAGYNCMAAHPRTMPAYTADFAKYLKTHPALLDEPIVGAFTVFIVDCPEAEQK